MSAHVIAAVDDEGKTCVAYWWFDQEVWYYKLDTDEGTYDEKNPLLLKD